MHVIGDLVNKLTDLIRPVWVRNCCILVYIRSKDVHVFSTVVQDFFLFGGLAELRYLQGVQKGVLKFSFG